uniref:glycerophosphodiester phosphodiesterase n=1 Tax=Araucaria cunninghamii TaxID=56994 RepID=A0A0D6QW44_ARACU
MASNDCGNGRVVWLKLVFLCLCSLHWTSAQKSSGWKTLSGKAPLVIADGGLSGLFPDQTLAAYAFALNNSLFDAVMFCDLQLTKDGEPICRTDLRLDNSTTIALAFPKQSKTYLVNGANVTGWFSIDFTLDEILNNTAAIQSFTSRTHIFDGSYQVLQPVSVAQSNPASIWLNVQYSKFFEEHNLSMPGYVRSLATLNWPLGYISSTEVGFLRDIALRFKRSKTKLILRFLDKENSDPSINETYGSILKNLTFVKTFAAGILVPKSYIWPQSTDEYLQAPTNLVKDAHAAGLEIFAGDFANDEFGMSYNYSYNPINEYLQFVDNGDFAVDGVLTDFSITASSAIACYAQNNDSVSSRAENPLIIAHNGASGDYPGSTDVAYQAAIRDGANYIECSVQITKDGIPFCMESPDLTVVTNIISNSAYYPSLMRSIPAIQVTDGIFTFDLTWKEIESLTPNIFSPYNENGFSLLRNPAKANVGKFMNLTAFLEFAKKQADIGVLLDIENARTIILKASLDVTNATLSALKMAGYDNMSDRLSIRSDDSAVLLQFKQIPTSNLVFTVDESSATVPDSTIQEIKGFANAVAVPRTLIYENDFNFILTQKTNLVTKMKHHNVSVFAINVRNEFPSLAMDYEADPTLQINSLVQVAKVDGLVTDFPATAKAYFGNACLRHQKEVDYSMFLVVPGSLLAVAPSQMTPASAPAPTLLNVVDPPLPALVPVSSPEPTSSPANVPAPSGKQPSGACCMKHSSFILLVMGLVILFFNSC